MGRIDPHRDARSGVLHEELARRVRVNPQVATLVVDRELVAPESVLCLCRCGLCHVAPPSWLVSLSSREDYDDDGDALEHADEHRPEHGRTAYTDSLEDHRRLNEGEDDPHGEGNALNTRRRESRPHLRRESHRVHEDQASNYHLEKPLLQEPSEPSIQSVNCAHRNLLSVLLEMCNRTTVARLFCDNHSIIGVSRQVQTKISISAVSCLKSYEFKD